MVYIPDSLHAVFSGSIEKHEDRFVVEIPSREIAAETIHPGETYRVALFDTTATAVEEQAQTRSSQPPESQPEHGGPPVTEGDTRRVEIEEIGEQGDGIAKIDRGYVVIVPDTERGERVEIVIDAVTENVAFAHVTERISYYE